MLRSLCCIKKFIFLYTAATTFFSRVSRKSMDPNLKYFFEPMAKGRCEAIWGQSGNSYRYAIILPYQLYIFNYDNKIYYILKNGKPRTTIDIPSYSWCAVFSLNLNNRLMRHAALPLKINDRTVIAPNSGSTSVPTAFINLSTFTIKKLLLSRPNRRTILGYFENSKMTIFKIINLLVLHGIFRLQ
ncbi:hypothetical protein DOLIC_00073 [Dolichomitus sp. PSUC_FEM 10030005]|nr:hypothetical protein [Dolichomitus sp. PSUC_FEM 10030005]